MYDVIIAGGGPAGLSALVWCYRLGLNVILLERNHELGGQLFGVHNPIIDYLGIPVENGRQLQKYFVDHVKKMGCPYECGVEIQKFDFQNKRLMTNQGEYHANFLIIGLGSRNRKIGVPGEGEMVARKEVYSASRDKELFTGKHVAVIGGGDRAVEGALLLAENGAHVTLIHRSETFKARTEYLNPVRNHPAIQILTKAEVKEIEGTDRVTEVIVEQEGKRQRIPVEAVFVRIGVEPNSDLLADQVKIDPAGYVLVDQYGETSMRNVFVVGDLCTRPLYSSVAGSIAQGMIAAKTISFRMETGVKTNE